MSNETQDIHPVDLAEGLESIWTGEDMDRWPEQVRLAVEKVRAYLTDPAPDPQVVTNYNIAIDGSPILRGIIDSAIDADIGPPEDHGSVT